MGTCTRVSVVDNGFASDRFNLFVSYSCHQVTLKIQNLTVVMRY